MNTATQMLNKNIELTISPRLAKNIRRNVKERVIEFILMLAALSAVATTIGIVAILLNESLGFFKTVSIVDFSLTLSGLHYLKMPTSASCRLLQAH